MYLFVHDGRGGVTGGGGGGGGGGGILSDVKEEIKRIV